MAHGLYWRRVACEADGNMLADVSTKVHDVRRGDILYDMERTLHGPTSDNDEDMSCVHSRRAPIDVRKGVH